MSNTRSKSRFALCVENKDCDDLEKGKIYRVLPDARAKRDDFLRVIDESGEDYLYPESHFVFVDLPAKAKKALLAVV
jgi:hypothetical protein